MPIHVDGYPYRHVSLIGTTEAKRSLTITLDRLRELVVALPTDKFAAIYALLLDQPHLIQGIELLALKIEKAALEGDKDGLKSD